MSDYEIFFNGVYQGVLEEILLIQDLLPEQILFLQPYKAERIVRFAEEVPSVDCPVQAYFSVTDDLARVHYRGEIVGWDDKRELSEEKLNVFKRLIWTLQPGEGGLYGRHKDPPMVNLLHVRRLTRVKPPFSVTRLRNVKDDSALSDRRTTAGSWVYVKPLSSE